MSRLTDAVAVLLGISAYQAAPPDSGPRLDDASVETVRESLGGQLSPPPTTQTRFYLSDLESAQYAADNGDIGPAARIMAGARTDGVYSGVLSTLTGGLVRLPRKFRGPPEMTSALDVGHEGDDGSVRSVFDDMMPPAELALMAADGKELGIAVGELLPVKGRDFPVLCRLNPEFLFYRWSENRWYYNSNAGALPITPGDGRWVLHLPGGRLAPWRNGAWRAVGRAWIPKEHARHHKDNWEAKLANPARVAVAPNGATEEQSLFWFQKVAAWGINTVFGVKPGWDVKLVESNGRGWEAYDKTADRSDREFMITIAGQIGTTEGGAGFSNKDLFEAVRADIIAEVAEALAYTINTQILPQWLLGRWGLEGIRRPVVVAYDTRKPRDKMAAAAALVQSANAAKAWREELAQHTVTDSSGKQVAPRLDIAELTTKFDVPVSGDADNDGKPEEAAETPKLRVAA